jgi:hypothetical protein
MAIFLYKFRNVRTKHSTTPSGTAGSAADDEVYYTYYDGASAPTGAQAKAALDQFLDSRGVVGVRPDISTAMAAGHASAGDRTNVATGAASFRVGKAIYQYAVAFHSSTLAGALAATTTWKNLS